MLGAVLGHDFGLPGERLKPKLASMLGYEDHRTGS